MTEAQMIARGDTKIIKKQFFCHLDGGGNPDTAGVTEQTFLDCDSNPTTPHVWISVGIGYSYYNEDELSVINDKIATKAPPLTVP